MAIFWTSDTHYGHDRVRDYSHRPFSSLEEMHETLINNWNHVVSPRDQIYHLGDFVFDKAGGDLTATILKRLNGHKHLIRGNHDQRNKWLTHPNRITGGFETIRDYAEIKHEGYKITLCHYAFAVWSSSHFGAINLHGHSHGSRQGNSQQLDVGVDCWDYTPCSWEQILERLKTLPPYQQGDKHELRKEKESI